MKILENIKKFFQNRKNKIKSLTEGEQRIYTENRAKTWRKTEKIEENRLLPRQEQKIVSSTIEQSISQYIEEYYNAWVREQKGLDRCDAYSVLTGLNAKQEPAGNNKQIQETLLQYIYNNPEYQIQMQTAQKTGDPNFIHIYHGNYEKNLHKMIRFYINTNRENVAKLSFNVIKKMGKEPFYFKMISDQLMQKKNRTEKLVFYTNEEQLNSVINVLIQIKRENPDLLKGAEDMNPFMKRIEGFIGYAPNPKSNVYTNIDGYSFQIEESYNNFLATALKESITIAMKEIVSRDKELTWKTNGEIGNINRYMSVYPIIKEKYQPVLIQKVKENLKILKQKNIDIEILGLEDEQNVR